MSDSDDRYPISEYPYYRIHNWSKHQPPEARHPRGSKFIRLWTNLLQDPRYLMLTLAERGLLHSLWLYKGGTGLNPPRDPVEVMVSTRGVRSKHTLSHLKSLERRGFITPDRYKRRGDKIREEKNPPNPPSQTTDPDPEPEHVGNGPNPTGYDELTIQRLRKREQRVHALEKQGLTRAQALSRVPK